MITPFDVGMPLITHCHRLLLEMEKVVPLPDAILSSSIAMNFVAMMISKFDITALDACNISSEMTRSSPNTIVIGKIV